jgi:hypothetical protein
MRWRFAYRPAYFSMINGRSFAVRWIVDLGVVRLAKRDGFD